MGAPAMAIEQDCMTEGEGEREGEGGLEREGAGEEEEEGGEGGTALSVLMPPVKAYLTGDGA